ncbi:hypothetical protein HDU93_007507 [Gonapodya sp. JEL0774]|nr:hypothetical protein HDU93_007507 [Gonapodya sp. JEL0774]
MNFNDPIYNIYGSRPERELPQKIGYEKNQKKIALAYPPEGIRRRAASAAQIQLSPIVAAVSSILAMSAALVPFFTSISASPHRQRKAKKDKDEDLPLQEGDCAQEQPGISGRDNDSDTTEPLTPGLAGVGADLVRRKTGDSGGQR